MLNNAYDIRCKTSNAEMLFRLTNLLNNTHVELKIKFNNLTCQKHIYNQFVANTCKHCIAKFYVLEVCCKAQNYILCNIFERQRKILQSCVEMVATNIINCI